MLLDIKNDVLIKYYGEECHCGSARLPEGIKAIGEGAFDGCWSLQEIRFPARITYIARGAFKGCSSLEEITLPDGLTTLEPELFALCDKLHSVSLPASITKVTGCANHSEGAFFSTPLTRLTLRACLNTSIDRNLTEITALLLDYSLTLNDLNDSFETNDLTL